MFNKNVTFATGTDIFPGMRRSHPSFIQWYWMIGQWILHV